MQEEEQRHRAELMDLLAKSEPYVLPSRQITPTAPKGRITLCSLGQSRFLFLH
jgi:hypothetical protein